MMHDYERIRSANIVYHEYLVVYCYNLIYPDIPLALAVACLTATVPGTLLPIPLVLAVIVLLITGISTTEAIPVFVSVIVAYAITHGLGLRGRGSSKEIKRNANRI